MKKKLTWLLALCMAVLLSAPMAKAAAAESSLTVRFLYEGAEFSLYHVAEVCGSDYEKTEHFLPVPVDLNDQDDVAVLAETLASYVSWMNIPADGVGTIDASRSVIFEGLAPGMYLLTAGTVTVNGVEYTTAPVLVLVRAGGSVVLSPKPGPVPPVSGDDFISRKVLKIWDDEEASERPDSVTVYLLCEEKPVETVELSDENNWSWRWDALDANQRWAVAEEPVAGYCTRIEKKGITFVITNTACSDDPHPGDDPTDDPSEVPEDDPSDDPEVDSGGDPKPDEPKLPQTGLLWWPVPVLAGSGMVLFAAGWWKNRRDEDE